MRIMLANSGNRNIGVALALALLPLTLAFGQISEVPKDQAAMNSPLEHEQITPLATLSRTISTTGPSSQTTGGRSQTSNEATLLQATQSLVVAHSKVIRLQPDASLATEELMPIRLAPSGARYEATLAKLELPVNEIDFRETPLVEVLAFLADKQGVEIDIDTRSLEDYGIAPDVPVTLKASGISLNSALRRLLWDCDLGFTVHDDGLVRVTTMDEEDNNLSIVAYPIPLVIDDDPTTLIHLIQQTVAPTTWNAVGGQGSVVIWRNTLLVSHTLPVHHQVLAVLRNYASAEFPQSATTKARSAGGPVLRSYHVADDALRQDLAEQLVSMCNVVLGERGDPSADVSVIGSSILVRSSKRAFHVYASQLIHAIVGVPVTSIEVSHDTADGFGRMGIGGGGMF